MRVHWVGGSFCPNPSVEVTRHLLSIKTSKTPRFRKKSHPGAPPLCFLHFGVHGAPSVWAAAGPVCIDVPPLWADGGSGNSRCCPSPGSSVRCQSSSRSHTFWGPCFKALGYPWVPLSMLPISPRCRSFPLFRATFQVLRGSPLPGHLPTGC